MSVKTALMISGAAMLLLAAPAANAQQNAATPSATQGNAQSNASQSPGIRTVTETAADVRFYTLQSNDLSASNLIGMNVYNADDEHIGEIEDIVIDDGKNIKAIVIGVGGFLGLGERNVAVEPGSVLLQKQADGSERALVHTTKENLENAPVYEMAKRKTG